MMNYNEVVRYSRRVASEVKGRPDDIAAIIAAELSAYYAAIDAGGVAAAARGCKGAARFWLGMLYPEFYADNGEDTGEAWNVAAGLADVARRMVGVSWEALYSATETLYGRGTK